MSRHWMLAFRSSLWIAGMAVLVGGVLFYVYGGSQAGAFWHGAAIGVLSLFSTALTVSLLTKGPGLWRMLGAATFFVRYIFVAVTLGIPAYLGLWPGVAMLGGFAGVYLTENTVLLPGFMKAMSETGAKAAPDNDMTEWRQ
ncbi:hypothetical protein [Rubrobacter aplysinae]|uniref:hypothetical protein n=1 Tax=Rubrobacter aplysinae TaxID=909625 RepID=UPI00064B8962|nr:hypothetical protein [Rubrobacter aplysinae]